MIGIFSSKKFTVLVKKVLSISQDLAALKNNLKSAFASTKDELDIHLDSINQNTNEIQSNYESIAELDSKIEKLSDRIDEISLMLNPSAYMLNYDDVKLSKSEQELFLNLYTVEDRISVLDLSKKCGLTLKMCDSLLQGLFSKRIPIMRQLVDGMIFVSLEYTFKDLQARKNILKIDHSVSQMIS